MATALQVPVTIDPQQWACEQFGDCEFGDLRRTKRLVKAAEQSAAPPDGSTPDQTESWSDCQAVSRLMDCDEVTHAEIIRPHCEQTRQSCAAGSTKLILCDTTEIDFQREIEGIGPVGKGTGRGFFLHTGLMRDAASGTIDGMAGQVLFHRRPQSRRVPKNSQRRDPQRESVVWGLDADLVRQFYERLLDESLSDSFLKRLVPIDANLFEYVNRILHSDRFTYTLVLRLDRVDELHFTP